jgi:hypothetical protein
MEPTNFVPKSFKIILGVVAVIALAALISNGVLWSRINMLGSKTEKTELDEDRELAEIVAKVGQFITLPKDESPTLLTLTEAELEAVRGQVFFANALIGDKLLIYQNNSKAVLWRPSAEKIIEASIINLSPTPTQ